MIVGIDYYRTISAYPQQFDSMITNLIAGGHTVYIVSAVGGKSAGTVEQAVIDLYPWLVVYSDMVHEVRFKRPHESPALKLAKCKELGIEIFYDDRQDVVDMLNDNGILAFKVPRVNGTDTGADQK